MSTSPNASRLFTASCLALIVTAMSFALRGGATGTWTTEFNLTNEQVGWINGTAFWGFTLAMMFGGPLCDAIGMGRIVKLAFVGHLAGILLTIFAWDYWSLFGGKLLFGIAIALAPLYRTAVVRRRLRDQIEASRRCPRCGHALHPTAHRCGE